MGIRLGKFIADSGVASRRAAEELVKNGAVSVNGQVIDTPVFFVEDDDVVCVNGNEIKRDTDIKLYAFHKPINTMTTARDPMKRKTIYDVLDDKYKNLKYIGRLDFKTTGLLLMTNNGDFARKMSLPESHIERSYIATVDKYSNRALDIARKGVCIADINYRPMKIQKLNAHNLKVTLEEGKKNEIRIVFKYIGAPIKALHRVSYGPVMLGKLGVGKILEIDKKTIDLMLKNF